MAIPAGRHIGSGAQDVFRDYVARRNPKIGFIRESENVGHHPNDRQRFSICGELLSQDIWIASKATLPEALADHCNTTSTEVFFVTMKNAAKHWIDAQHRKQI